jgi:myo-inositol-1(or 4)-monophosphatase
VARAAAERAGAILRERFGRCKEAETKSTPIDLVTEADRAAERAILAVLGEAFPDHAILAEESGPHGSGDSVWLVDPLDGTTNFAHSYPQISVALALRRDGQTVLGVVHDPLRFETFVARRGAGATLNGQPIRVSAVGSLSEALLLTGFPYDRRRFVDFYLDHVREFMTRAQGIRRGGSAALDLCWVAAGRADGFWEWKLKPWDTAAGALIVEEAGGTVTDFRGSPFDPFGEQCLATNGRLHREMLDVLGPLLARRPW